MTRTRAAADAALPSDRRTFISNSLALASVVAASAAVPAMAAEHPDAALLALGREWETSTLREMAANKANNEADDRYICPPWPEAVYWRPDDVFRREFLFPETSEDGSLVRYRYGFIDGEAELRGLIAKLEKTPDLYEWQVQQLARAREIVAAYADWRKEDDRQEIESGAVETLAALRKEVEHNRALIWQIVETPARTLDGIFLKARAILWTQHDTVAELEKEWRETAEASPREAEQPTGLLLDILRLSGTTHAVGSAVRA